MLNDINQVAGVVLKELHCRLSDLPWSEELFNQATCPFPLTKKSIKSIFISRRWGCLIFRVREYLDGIMVVLS